jgi:hypothetical protein
MAHQEEDPDQVLLARPAKYDRLPHHASARYRLKLVVPMAGVDHQPV